MRFSTLAVMVGGLLASSVAGYAQDFDHYQPLQQSGRFPLEFSKRSSEKYREQLSQVDARKRYERKAQETFYLESNFCD